MYDAIMAPHAVLQVHGQVLEGWMLNQLAQAAQQRAQGAAADAAQTLRRLDTFLAAIWQAYVEFTEDMAKQVRRQWQHSPMVPARMSYPLCLWKACRHQLHSRGVDLFSNGGVWCRSKTLNWEVCACEGAAAGD